MKFYHGTNEHGLRKTIAQGFLLHERATPSSPNMSPCVYLAVDVEEARRYGEFVIEVEYDPFRNPGMNNYCPGCWQCRVYEPIYEWSLLVKSDDVLVDDRQVVLQAALVAAHPAGTIRQFLGRRVDRPDLVAKR